MNHSDDKKPFSTTPKEDRKEHDKTDLLPDAIEDAGSEIVDGNPMLSKEELEENQNDMEEVINNEISSVEELEQKEVLENELEDEVIDNEIVSEEVDNNIENIENTETETEIENSVENIENTIEEAIEESVEELVNEDSQNQEETEVDTETEVTNFVEPNQDNTIINETLTEVENIETEIENRVENDVENLENEFSTMEESTLESEGLSQEASTIIEEEDTGRKPNFLFAILGGLFAILIGSLVWAESASLLDEYYNYDYKYPYMALFVGLCVGLGIRWAGRGKTYGFGILAIIFTLCGSLSGTLLSTLVHTIKAFGISYFDILEVFDFNFLIGLIENRYNHLDILFYTGGVLIAYFVAIKKRRKK